MSPGQGAAYRLVLASRAADPGAERVRELRRALRRAHDVLEGLRDEVGHTVSMGALDGTRVLYVHRFFGPRRGQHLSDRELRVGAYVPAYCTALGKVLLAGLPEAKRQTRVATIHLVPQGPRSITELHKLLAELDDVDPRAPTVSDEELVMGARSIAILVSGAAGKQPVAIDVTVPSDLYTDAQLVEQDRAEAHAGAGTDRRGLKPDGASEDQGPSSAAGTTAMPSGRR